MREERINRNNPDHIHSCGYHCDIPACIKKQRDEFVNQLEQFEKNKKDAARYETIRKLNAKQFADLYKVNISTSKPFDQLVDELAPFFARREP